MYIALRWLFSFALLMWLAMCFINPFKKDIQNYSIDIDNKHIELIFKNTSVQKHKPNAVRLRGNYKHEQDREQSTTGLHIVVFLAGVLAVKIFNKKQEIITFAQRKISILNMRVIIKSKLTRFKVAAKKFTVAILNDLPLYWKTIQIIVIKFIIYLKTLHIRSKFFKHNNIHAMLLKKLKDVREEKRNLGQLLIAAIQENKNIRLRYQLETMTKNRLMQHIEDTQNQIKENRSRYIDFQQLYLITHQENNFLKSRIRKLKEDKDTAEKNLMGLISEVYMSKNAALKAYCSRFIVKTKNILLNSDVNAEIEKFLEKSRNTSAVAYSCSKQSYNKVKNARRWSRYSDTRITEISNENDSLVPLISDTPKLKGLPGERVWTVKDKNGMIEKLYEYDYESNLDTGDTIKRIRQYSVYYDKDCLLDFVKMEYTSEAEASSPRNNLEYPLVNHKIVTGSEAFKMFLQNNKSLVPPRSHASPMLCG